MSWLEATVLVLVLTLKFTYGNASNSNGYYFYSGCEKGSECENGTYCGNTLKNGISFEDCQREAENEGSYAFAYRGTSDRQCRLCKRLDFDDIDTDEDWGIYKENDFSGWIEVCNLCICGNGNREFLAQDVPLEECEQLCEADSHCRGIEAWHNELPDDGGHLTCYKCYDPEIHKHYNDPNDISNPPSVHKPGERTTIAPTTMRTTATSEIVTTQRKTTTASITTTSESTTTWTEAPYTCMDMSVNQCRDEALDVIDTLPMDTVEDCHTLCSLIFKDECNSYIYYSDSKICTILEDHFYYFYECNTIGAGHDTIQNCLEDDARYPDSCKKMIESDCVYNGNVIQEDNNISDAEECFQLNELLNGKYYVHQSDTKTCWIYDSDSRTCNTQRGIINNQPSDCPK